MNVHLHLVRMTELPHLVYTGCPGSFHLQRRRRKAGPEIALAMLEPRLLNTASLQVHRCFDSFCCEVNARAQRKAQ